MLPSSFPSVATLPRGGTEALVDACVDPNVNLGAGEEPVGAEEAVSELLPNENSGAVAFAVVSGLLLPKEKGGASCLLSLSFVVELDKLKLPPFSPSVLFRFCFAGGASAGEVGLAPKLNLGAGAEVDPEEVEEAKLPNNCVPLFALGDGCSPLLDSEDKAVTLLDDPNEKGLDAGAGEFFVLESPNLKPPDTPALLDEDAAPKLKPLVEALAELLGVADDGFDVEVALNLNPPDASVAVVAEGGFAAAPNLKPPLSDVPLVVEDTPNWNPPAVDDAGAATVVAGAGAPNENPPEDIFPPDELPPNEKPELPIDPPKLEGFADVVAVADSLPFVSTLSPDFDNGAKQLSHFVRDSSL